MVFPRPVSFSSGLDVPSERAVISGSCVDGPSAQSVMKECRAISQEFDEAMSFGGSGGKGTLQTSPAFLVTSQLDEGTQSAPAGPVLYCSPILKSLVLMAEVVPGILSAILTSLCRISIVVTMPL